MLDWIDDWMKDNDIPEEEPFRYFILENGKMRPSTLMEWSRWFGNFDNRTVDRTDIDDLPNYPGGEFISTVCLGLDHNFIGVVQAGHKPALFETMIFGGKYDQRMWRYASYGEAKVGHWNIVDCIRAGRPPEAETGERPWIDYFFEMLDKTREENNDADV